MSLNHMDICFYLTKIYEQKHIWRNRPKTYTSAEDVLRDVWDSNFEVYFGSDFGDLSSSEEEMIDRCMYFQRS